MESGNFIQGEYLPACADGGGYLFHMAEQKISAELRELSVYNTIYLQLHRDTIN